MPAASRQRPVGVAIVMLVAGSLGLVAAFALTLDKITVLQDPNATLGCNFGVLVQCGANLSSPQGELLGFPNPLIGLVAFPTVIAVGAAILAGARFARWFWMLLELGIAGGMAFVVWLISVSIFVLGTLCPWCMLVWAAMIPLFLTVTLHIAGAGLLPLPGSVRRAASALLGWVPFLTLLCYLAVVIIAQLRLNLLQYL